MSINNSPALSGVNGIGEFRYWCQKVLPLVYDDSLSYYEVLCKVAHKLNETIASANASADNVGKLKQAYDELLAYINSYFDGLDEDVIKAVNDKLQNMTDSGELYEYVISRITASDIGAAPAGYGIGGAVKNVATFNDVNSAGWYSKWFNEDEMPDGAVHGSLTFRTGIYGGPEYFEVIMPVSWTFNDYSVLSEIRKRRDGDSWTPWEWVNPPMIQGVEYRTTERYNGKAVYTKVINCGNLDVGTWKTVEFSGATGGVLRYSGMCVGTAIPFNPFPVQDPNNNIQLGITANTIYISKGTTTTINGDIYLQLWYIK